MTSEYKFSQLRLGIDAEALRSPMSGVGRYVYEFCAHIEKRLPAAQLFGYGRYPRAALRFPSERWIYRQETNPLRQKLPSFLWLKTFGRQLARKDDLDVFWAGRTLTPGKGAARVLATTVHDLNHLVVPETMQASTRISHRLWFERDVAGADCVYVNSAGTRDRLLRQLGIDADDIIRLGVTVPSEFQGYSARGSQLSALQALGIVPPYLLTVSTLEPRKNVPALVDAFVALKRSGRLPAPMQLVIAGAKGWIGSDAYRRIAALAPEGVTLPGYVPEALMGPLYANAELLVFPSRYEGFGIPVLEARAWGTPTVVTRVPELIEAGENESIVVDFDASSIADGIVRGLATGRHLRAADFYRRHAWERSGDRFIEALQVALERKQEAAGLVSGAAR
ncbi:glycosyltransferase family 4 protein [Derxia lacustris]|uniref:glycosyltransferase family 4 protein n=1 Tax=Derxia lacustris TaxID=764842 RepID=UPI000A16EFB4|nr:glycosyltransferase family 1 protein [Derxia lacustris]